MRELQAGQNGTFFFSSSDLWGMPGTCLAASPTASAAFPAASAVFFACREESATPGHSNSQMVHIASVFRAQVTDRAGSWSKRALQLATGPLGTWNDPGRCYESSAAHISAEAAVQRHRVRGSRVLRFLEKLGGSPPEGTASLFGRYAVQSLITASQRVLGGRAL